MDISPLACLFCRSAFSSTEQMHLLLIWKYINKNLSLLQRIWILPERENFLHEDNHDNNQHNTSYLNTQFFGTWQLKDIPCSNTHIPLAQKTCQGLNHLRLNAQHMTLEQGKVKHNKHICSKCTITGQRHGQSWQSPLLFTPCLYSQYPLSEHDK